MSLTDDRVSAHAFTQLCCNLAAAQALTPELFEALDPLLGPGQARIRHRRLQANSLASVDGVIRPAFGRFSTEFPFAWRTQLDETVMVVRPAGRLVLPWCERARY